MSNRTFEKMHENRLAKMREGQAAGEICDVDEDTRCVLVPLTDGEWLKALSIADRYETAGSEAGFMAREEMLKQATLLYACREMFDFQTPFFNSLQEVATLEHYVIHRMYDEYLEMIATASPPYLALSEEELEILKKVWSQIEWSELTGRQWYAAQRFLNSIRPNSRQGNSFGSRSTKSSTPTSTTPDYAESAEPKKTTPIFDPVEDAERNSTG